MSNLTTNRKPTFDIILQKAVFHDHTLPITTEEKNAWNAAVAGPSGATIGSLAVFSDTTGQHITDSTPRVVNNVITSPAVTAGQRNEVYGFNAGVSLTTGRDNLIIGCQAGNSLTTGDYNTFIGSDSGDLNTGSSNIFIGRSSGSDLIAVSNTLIVDNQARVDSTTQSMLYGVFDIDPAVQSLTVNAVLSTTYATSAYGLVTQYGTDNTEGSGYNTQANGFVTDTLIGCDSGFTHSVAGVPKWQEQIYRGENGQFWYLYSVESGNDVLAISDGGRLGLNKATNFINYHALWVDPELGQLNDMDAGGVYIRPMNTLYWIYISSLGTPDQFVYKTSFDNGVTWSAPSAPMSCSTTDIPLDAYGVTVIFENTTGHNLFDAWQFTAFAQLPEGTMTISSTMFDEVNTTTDYTVLSPEWTDLSYNVATLGTTPNDILPIGDGGTNKGAIYLGCQRRFNAAFINVVQPAFGASIIYEFWNGTVWEQIDGLKGLIDLTYGLTVSDTVIWDKNLLIGWDKSLLAGKDPGDEGYFLYWIRIRSLTVMSMNPTAYIVTPQSDMRFAVYSGFLDNFPTYKIDGLGSVYQYQKPGLGSALNILNLDDDGYRASVNVEVGNVAFNIYGGSYDNNHKTTLGYGQLSFGTIGEDAIIKHKFNQALKIYNNDTSLVLTVNANGLLTAGTVGYESLLSHDNDIPNKKYVDLLIGGFIIQGNWDANLNNPDITGTTTSGFAWLVTVAGTTNLGGITSWAKGDLAVKTATGWTKNTPVPAIWGTIGGTLADQSDLQNALNAKVSTSALATWTGTSYISTVGTITSGSWTGNRIDKNYLDTSVTVQGNTFNGPSQLIQATVAGAYPALDGSAITNLGAVLLTGDQTIAGLKTFSSLLTASSGINIPSGEKYKINNVALAYGDVGAEPANSNIQAHISNSTTAHGLTIANVTIQGNVFNGANQLVQMTSDSKLPAVSAANLTNFPTFNQSTTGSAGSLKSSATTGLMFVTGMAAGTLRVKTVSDSDDTILELGGSYTPTGTWTSMTLVTPALGTPASGNLANCTFPTLNQDTTGKANKATNLTGGNNGDHYGSMPYQVDVDTTNLLAPNTTLVKKFLRMTGTGINGTAPAWDTIVSGDVPTLNQNTSGSAGSLLSTATTGVMTITGPSTGTTRLKTIRDAADTLLELGGSYTPNGTWNWTSATVTWPTFNQNTSGSSGSCTGNSVSASKATNLVGGNSTTLLGSIPYQANTDTTILLTPNVSTTRKFLRMIGDGTNGAVPAWDTMSSGDIPILNQSTSGSAASLKSSSNTGLMTVTGMGAGTTRSKTVRDADDTILELGGSYTPSGTWTSMTLVTPALGTPASGNLANCSFPTLNQSTSGSAASLKSSSNTGLMTVTGMGVGVTRSKTVRDVDDTILELGGSYTPTGTWTSMTLVTPALGTPASGNLANCSFPTLNQSSTGSAGSLKDPSTTGLVTLASGTITAGQTRVKTFRDVNDTVMELGGSYTPTGTWVWTSASVTWPTFNQSTSGTASNLSGTPALPNGTTASTQTQGDASTKLATTSYVDTGLSGKQNTLGFTAVPDTRQVNGHALNGDITITKGDLSLGSVENTALSTWAGTANITTVGTLSSGTVPWSLLSNLPGLAASVKGLVTLPASASGKVLDDSGNWVATAAGGVVVTNVTSASASPTQTAGQALINCNYTGVCTINLPTSVGNLCQYSIKNSNTSGGTVIVDAFDGELIDGELTMTLNFFGTNLMLYSNNGNWVII